MIDRPALRQWCASVEQQFVGQTRVPAAFLQTAIDYIRVLCGTGEVPAAGPVPPEAAPAAPAASGTAAKAPDYRPLLEEAAFILEQEGWLLGRIQHDGGGTSRRVGQFADRYSEWSAKVKIWRAQHPGVWPEPPDNS